MIPRHYDYRNVTLPFTTTDRSNQHPVIIHAIVDDRLRCAAAQG